MKHNRAIALIVLANACALEEQASNNELDRRDVPHAEEAPSFAEALDRPPTDGRDDATTLPELPRVAGASQALFGGTNYSTEILGNGDPLCTEGDKAVFRQIMILGRTIAQSTAMRQCVSRLMLQGEGNFGPYVRCSADPWAVYPEQTRVEKVQGLLESPNQVQIGCRGTGGGLTQGSDMHTYSYSGVERFDTGNVPLSHLRSVSLIEDRVESEPYGDEADAVFRWRMIELAQSAGTVWHEAMHVHGYWHEAAGCEGGQNLLKTVPHIVGQCVRQVAAASLDRCNVRGSCGSGRDLALIDSYPVTSSTGCRCYGDAVGAASNTTEHPPTPRLDANEAGDRYGASMAVGDFNEDGFDDLAVGAPGENDSTGRVYIYYGGVLRLAAAVELNQAGLGAEEPGDKFGFSLAAADFDLDGDDDLAVGAPGENDRTGVVFLFSGSYDGLTPNRVLWQTDMSDNSAGDEFGYALAAGKFFSGYQTTLAVGAPGEVFEGKRAGWVLLYAGGTSNPDLVVPWGRLRESANTQADGDRFGVSLAFGPSSTTIMDALAVGAPGDGGGKGRVFVFDGRSYGSSSTIPNTVLPSYSVAPPATASGGSFGFSVALGDLAGNRGLAVGAPVYSSADLNFSGAVHFYKDGRQANEGVTYNYLQPGNPGDFFGYSMQTISEGKSTYRNNLLVGAPARDGGRVYRYRSGFNSLGQGRALYQATYTQAGLGADEVGDNYGSALAVGDFDGSDSRDFVVGAPNESPGSDPASGAVFVRRALEAGGFGNWSAHNQND